MSICLHFAENFFEDKMEMAIFKIAYGIGMLILMSFAFTFTCIISKSLVNDDRNGISVC